MESNRTPWDKFFFKLPLKTEPIIDDSTLRDGIQMPGLAASPEDATEIVRLLTKLESRESRFTIIRSLTKKR